MTEYIRRDNAIDAIENADPEVVEEWDGTALFGYMINQIRYALNRVPAETDVVRVVRCKNYNYYREFNGRDMCAKNAVMLDGREVGLRATGKDEFCSYGR